MLKKVMMCAVLAVTTAVVSPAFVGAQVLPGTGNCWTCTYLYNDNTGNMDPACVSQEIGAFDCRFDTQQTGCYEQGSGCTSSSFSEELLAFETIACSDVLIAATSQHLYTVLWSSDRESGEISIPDLRFYLSTE